ncbi:MAG: hypothetical protein NVSMB27_17590 [Ktedonobacteraceae bacterium]
MSMIEQRYCQTEWGRVCYWFSTCLDPLEAEGTTEDRVQTVKKADAVDLKIVVFLHGLGGSGRYWLSYLEGLAQSSSCRVLALAPDLLGFGASDKPPLAYTPLVQLSVLQAVLQDSQAMLPSPSASQAQVYVVGHSMGGILALLLAAQLIEGNLRVQAEHVKLAGLVLLGTPYASPRHDMEREALRSPLTRAMLSYAPVCWMVHYSLKALWPLVLFSLDRGRVKGGLPLPVVSDYMRHTCQSYTSNARHIVFQANLEPALAVLACRGIAPGLLIYSRADREVPMSHGVELAQRLPGSELRLREETSHSRLGQVARDHVVAFISGACVAEGGSRRS